MANLIKGTLSVTVPDATIGDYLGQGWTLSGVEPVDEIEEGADEVEG